ncbi:hypothetical protein [Catenulispora subtropica]|uniref:Secreted protein n=1 Tax=Catenulispora subtropica TaxID=450798 RepID=A0ABP5D827_9ACTN
MAIAAISATAVVGAASNASASTILAGPFSGTLDQQQASCYTTAALYVIAGHSTAHCVFMSSPNPTQPSPPAWYVVA